MMLKNVCRNAGHGRSFLRLCHTQGKQQSEPHDSRYYGYALSDDGYGKRDKENKGVLHIGRVDLPPPLKDSLKSYYKKYPRKRIIQDGLKLSRYISNRGRPTHATWLKYKQEVAAIDRGSGKKAKDRNLVKQFSLEEAIEAGLVSKESGNEEIEDVKIENVTTEDIKTEDIKTEDIKTEDIKTENIVNTQIAETSYEDASIEQKSKRQKKSQIKRPQIASYSMIRYGSRETAAYAACQLPSVYGSTYKALYEIKKREPDYQPATLLDFGSGTGMSVWAGNAIWKNSITEYQCVDASEDMNTTAEYLLRGSSDIRKPLKVPNVYFKRFLPLSNQIKYDIVIAAYTLTEMPFNKQRLQAIQSLWRKTNDFLVIIEPGNNEGFETVLQARRYIAGKDQAKEDEYDYSCYEDSFGDYDLESGNEDVGHIFAPCTHELVCARTDVTTRDHPCNFTQKVELSFAYQTTPLKKLSYYNERFSYIILRKGKQVADHEKGWARILEPIKRRHRHVICELCCHNGNIEKHVVTKGKDPHIYKAARHFLEWGDMMPLDEVKRPMNIRPSPSCFESK